MKRIRLPGQSKFTGNISIARTSYAEEEPSIPTATLEKNNTDEPELIMEFDPVEVFQSKTILGTFYLGFVPLEQG